MPTINIAIAEKVATAESAKIVCGNSDYTTAFTFDAEWSDYAAKTARFVYRRSGRVYHVDVPFTGNECAAPIFEDITRVLIGVYAGDLHTTTPAEVECEKSILCGTQYDDDDVDVPINSDDFLLSVAMDLSAERKAVSRANIGAVEAVEGKGLSTNDYTTAEKEKLANAVVPDGYYSEMGVGTADNLAGKGDGVGASYIYRTTGGSADVANGRTTIKIIKGNTIVSDGALLSFNATGLKTVGFNAFNGTYAAVLGGNAYYIGGAYTSLGFTDTLGGTTESITPVNHLYTPSTNGYIYVTGGGANTCINLSWSGIRNGEYEDYWTQTRNLPIATYFPNGMRKAGTAYDELTAVKATTRISVVDLGTLDYNYSTSTSMFVTTIPNIKRNANWAYSNSNAICAEYSQNNYYSIADKQFCFFVSGVNYRCGFMDTAYPDAAAFKTAMSGVYMFYELETPTEVEITTPLNLVYMVSDFGTEEIITADNAETAPCNMSVVYGMNAVDFIRNAPKNYISVESFDGFAAALGAALNVTITKTWDDTNGKYTFTVVANS